MHIQCTCRNFRLLWTTLRMVPTVVALHTFCASRDAQIFLLVVPTNTAIFLRNLKNYAEKTEFSKCSWYPKRKLGVTIHFSETISVFKISRRPSHVAATFLFATPIFTLINSQNK